MASSSSTTHKRRRTGNTDYERVILDVLDCKICLDPLTVPVYQCKNGHVVCKTCCQKLKSKCPTCRLQIDCRCRLIEEIIESLKSNCQNRDYGCKDLLNYGNRADHEKNCIYEQYPCPQPSCHFRGLSDNLSQHFRGHHALYRKSFRYGIPLFLHLAKYQKIYVLEESSTGDLFVLGNTIADFIQNKVSISSVKPSPSGRVRGHPYELEVTGIGSSNLKKQRGLTTNVRSISDEPNAPALMTVRNEYVRISLYLPRP